MSKRIAVVGFGITGAAAALELSTDDTVEVEVLEAGDDVGGRLQGTTFAGVDDVDTAADAFLARVPDAAALCAEIGLDDLVHPEPVGAAVWHGGRLHDVPPGLALGVPGRLLPLARSGLLSWRGKVRAGIEPLLPRSSTDDDSIGHLVRARFGDEVHDRIVDALVGSIYAADTDRFSLAEVPQLAGLAEQRSLLLAARRVARRAAGTATATRDPIFAAPRTGMASMVRRAAEVCRDRRVTFRLRRSPTLEVRPDGGVDVDGVRFDAVVLATPPPVTADLVCAPGFGDEAGRLLAAAERADVAMVLLHVPGGEWPDELGGRSGYLVPKSVQTSVTAVSFGSQKWAHWRPPGGGELLRVSLGRDGAPILHLDDDEIVERALADLATHLGVAFTPIDARVARWPGAFAQYRPHHRRWVESVRAALPPRVEVAGAGYDGIGVPACVRSGRAAARRAAAAPSVLAD
jgi:oxygen-dependent protoporphyrinogen oxidase